jgi:hypothetical protein
MNTQINIAFKPTNMVQHHLQTHPNTDKFKNSGVYHPQCNTCRKSYVGQCGRSILTRHKEHLRYIRTNNPISTYALHILNNQHEFGPPQQTLQLLQPCTKGTIMNQWEAFYIQRLHNLGSLIEEQQPPAHSPLFTLCSFGWLHTEGDPLPAFTHSGESVWFSYTLRCILTYHVAATHLMLLLLFYNFFYQYFNHRYTYFLYIFIMYFISILALMT